MRCWQCGVEPTGLVEVTTLGDQEPRYLPTGWPDSDHDHAEHPPSPTELQDSGDAALGRVLKAWT